MDRRTRDYYEGSYGQRPSVVPGRRDRGGYENDLYESRGGVSVGGPRAASGRDSYGDYADYPSSQREAPSSSSGALFEGYAQSAGAGAYRGGAGTGAAAGSSGLAAQLTEAITAKVLSALTSSGIGSSGTPSAMAQAQSRPGFSGRGVQQPYAESRAQDRGMPQVWAASEPVRKQASYNYNARQVFGTSMSSALPLRREGGWGGRGAYRGGGRTGWAAPTRTLDNNMGRGNRPREAQRGRGGGPGKRGPTGKSPLKRLQQNSTPVPKPSPAKKPQVAQETPQTPEAKKAPEVSDASAEASEAPAASKASEAGEPSEANKASAEAEGSTATEGAAAEATADDAPTAGVSEGDQGTSKDSETGDSKQAASLDKRQLKKAKIQARIEEDLKKLPPGTSLQCSFCGFSTTEHEAYSSHLKEERHTECTKKQDNNLQMKLSSLQRKAEQLNAGIIEREYYNLPPYQRAPVSYCRVCKCKYSGRMDQHYRSTLHQMAIKKASDVSKKAVPSKEQETAAAQEKFLMELTIPETYDGSVLGAELLSSVMVKECSVCDEIIRVSDADAHLQSEAHYNKVVEKKALMEAEKPVENGDVEKKEDEAAASQAEPMDAEEPKATDDKESEAATEG
ncbi:unnamed protein product [Cyprideis torosa]|uniref:Uncharacterized protein n=1 Tax=Cyprideis torosa TaxID=163714 RepID=A0A7R8ZHR6_9CRUS|nr:unnamed protein product [Cyprideis torosa]CAG0883101.1 unnamed protein product [Cyprideis torosa]